ncbi:MAG: hypothetical protein H7A25_22245 [Leptospiraceae bacterium]|nr:hypothetical protein [Leptospiraceae bacterium]
MSPEIIVSLTVSILINLGFGYRWLRELKKMNAEITKISYENEKLSAEVLKLKHEISKEKIEKAILLANLKKEYNQIIISITDKKKEFNKILESKIKSREKKLSELWESIDSDIFVLQLPSLNQMSWIADYFFMDDDIRREDFLMDTIIPSLILLKVHFEIFNKPEILSLCKKDETMLMRYDIQSVYRFIENTSDSKNKKEAFNYFNVLNFTEV